MTPRLDADGQPSRSFTGDREVTRDLEHLLGLCRGLVADNRLVPDEVVYLDAWLKDHHALLDTWPGQILATRLRDVLADDQITEDEASDLQETIESLIGGGIEDGVAAGGATMACIDTDAEVDLQGARICFTGKLIRGSRAECQRISEQYGAVCGNGVNRKLVYLIIGDLASRAWANSSHGRKIDQAMTLKEQGYPVAIISETQWIQAIRG